MPKVSVSIQRSARAGEPATFDRHEVEVSDRASILDAARDLLDWRPGPVTLDEIAAVLGTKRDHIRGYFTSPQAVERALASSSTSTLAG